MTPTGLFRQLPESMSRRLYCIIATFASMAPTLAAQPIDVYVLAGQSNMSGGGAIADLPTEPFDYTQPQDVPYYFNIKASQSWHSVGFEQLRPLWPGYTGTTYGPELTFARTLRNLSPNPLAIVKLSSNGSDLQNNWDPTGENGTLYATMVNEVQTALGLLGDEGYQPTIKGFVWVQGSGDAGVEEKALEYEANLTELFATVRQDFGDPNLPAVINQLHMNTNRGFRNLLRQSQANVVAADPHAFMINMDDRPMKSDRVHYLGPEYLEMGRRLALSLYLGTGGEPGDYNGDGVVDAADYTVWRDQQGMAGSGLSADGDKNGVVDDADLWYWRYTFGATTPQALGATGMSVPEPSSVIFLGAAGLMCWAVASRR